MSNWQDPFPLKKGIQLFAQDSNWQHIVKKMFQLSDIIIVFVEKFTRGIIIELDLVIDFNLTSNTIILYDPANIDFSDSFYTDHFKNIISIEDNESIIYFIEDFYNKVDYPLRN